MIEVCQIERQRTPALPPLWRAQAWAVARIVHSAQRELYILDSTPERPVFAWWPVVGRRRRRDDEALVRRLQADGWTVIQQTGPAGELRLSRAVEPATPTEAGAETRGFQADRRFAS